MTQPCVHFKLLQERVESLTDKFVAGQLAAETADPINFQPDLDSLAAYRLLVHAELEDFLEGKAKENIAKIDSNCQPATKWMRNHPELLSLAIVLNKPAPQYNNLDASKLVDYMRELVRAAREAISDNNGIKGPSFGVLSICSGKTIDEIDDALAASLTSYGKDRGDVAHKSVTHTSCLNAPSSEALSAKNLVRELSIYFDVCA